MQTTEEEVNAKIGDDDAEEGESAVEKEFLRLTANGKRGIQGKGIDNEGDECPDFFGVPGPVVSPRDVGPEGTDNDAEGQQKYRQIKQPLR